MSALRICLLLSVLVKLGSCGSCEMSQGSYVTKRADRYPGLSYFGYKTWLQPQFVMCKGDCDSTVSVDNPSDLSSSREVCSCCQPRFVLATEVQVTHSTIYWRWQSVENGLFYTFEDCDCRSRNHHSRRKRETPQHGHHCQAVTGSKFSSPCNPQEPVQFCWSKTRKIIKPERMAAYRQSVVDWVKGGAKEPLPLSDDVLTEEEYTPRSWTVPRTFYLNPPAVYGNGPDLPGTGFGPDLPGTGFRRDPRGMGFR